MSLEAVADLADIAGMNSVLAWQRQAACRGTDVHLFFPEQHQPGTHTTRLAKALCAACPVKADCLEFAVTEGITHGTWGGLSQKELGRLRTRRRLTTSP